MSARVRRSPVGNAEGNAVGKSATDALADGATELRQLLQVLVLELGQITRDAQFGGMVIRSHERRWIPLPVEARREQGRALDIYRRHSALVRTLLRGQPATVSNLAAHADYTIGEALQQDGSTLYDSPQEAFDAASKALDTQLELVSHLPAADNPPLVVVPDTNALLANPHLDQWSFAVQPFSVVLVPSVLKELDERKMRANREEVRERAESVVRQIKEYGRRGDLDAGVVLRRGVSTIRAVAVEPQMDASLPWLDATNADDRTIASLLDVMRLYPRSPVLLVTVDVNLQNKARFARLPFAEPPSQSALETR
jgi:hypothetical protein